MSGKNKVLLIALIFFAGVYFAWRVGWSFPMYETVAGKVIAVVVLVVEFLGFLELVSHLMISTVSEKKKDLATTEGVPDVDVFVTACGEPTALIEETLCSCAQMEYPKERLHVWLCDDGDDDELQAFCEEQGLGYLIREEHDFAKAGNLNAALARTTSPLVAVFDADMRPSKEFLLRTVPHMLGDRQEDGVHELDEKVGYVQTPQSFDTPDLFQSSVRGAIPNEQDYFYFSIEPSRNGVNAVILAGTNMLISRKALEEVGGFSTDTVTEDFATGIEIQKRGYESVYLNEELAFGKVPADLPSLISQRKRWARGCIRSLRSTRLLSADTLTGAQKISYLLAIFYWYFPVKRLVYLAGPLLYALLGISVMRCTFLELVVCWLPYYATAVLALWSFSGRKRTSYLSCFYELCLTPFLLVPVLLETVGIRQRRFAVTRKDGKRRWNAAYLLPFVVGILLHVVALMKVIPVVPTVAQENAFIIIWLAYDTVCLFCSLFFVLACRRVQNEEIAASDHTIRLDYYKQLNPISMFAGCLRRGGQK